MKPARSWALTGAVALGLSMAAMTGPSAAASPHPGPAHRIALRGTLAPAKERAHRAGTVAGTSQVRFDLTLSLRNATAAQAFVRQVSSPGSAQFHHYLTDAQWISRFGPARAGVAKAEAWVRHEGFKVGSVANDRLFVSVAGTARRVERAFGATWMRLSTLVRWTSCMIAVPSIPPMCLIASSATSTAPA